MSCREATWRRPCEVSLCVTRCAEAATVAVLLSRDSTMSFHNHRFSFCSFHPHKTRAPFIVSSGSVSVGCVQPAVCSPSGWCVPEDTGGHTHPPVPPRGASPPPALLQQPASPAGDREGGEEDQQPRTACHLCAVQQSVQTGMSYSQRDISILRPLGPIL